MRQRPHALEAVESLIDLALVVGTSIGSGASSVIARIRGDGPSSDEDDDQTFEEQDAEVWGEANLLFRPLDPTDEGSCEAIFVRRGDTRELIGFRDRRWQVTLEQGEVVLRNIVADANKRASITLNKDGEAVIDAVKVYVGTSSATEKIALGTAIKNFLNDLKSWLDGHVHGATTTATIGASATVGVVTVTAPTTTSPVIPTIESRHVVEGA